MFACEKYFDEATQKRITELSSVVVIGISGAMFNVISWLKIKGIKNIVAADPLFKANPYVDFMGTRVTDNPYTYDPRNHFFIVTAFYRKASEQIFERLNKAALYGNVLKIPAAREIRLEASGICNLHCMSCQCGNYDSDVFSFEGRKFLEPELCDKILEKLGRDYEDNMSIFYYTFGEPFLNPELPELVRLAKERGLSVILSTNFSYNKDLAGVLDAKPDVLKISVSGFTQKIYSVHHNGGNIELVHANMKKLCDIKENYPDTVVVVGYHIYTDNNGEELEKTRQLCNEYGFIFAPVRAIYNNPLKRMGVLKMTEEDISFLKSCYPDYKSQFAFEEVSENINSPCRNIEDKLFVDYDGRIMLCELLHKDAVYKNYLDSELSEINSWRRKHKLCLTCRKHGLQLV